jgi:plasmid stabilization system protein ParE
VRDELLRIRFSNMANDDIDQVAHYLHDEYPSTYQKIREEIFSAIEKIAQNPTRHPPDRFKKDNQGEYRAFERRQYRISYKIHKDFILILRIRHVRQMPLDH